MKPLPPQAAMQRVKGKAQETKNCTLAFPGSQFMWFIAFFKTRIAVAETKGKASCQACICRGSASYWSSDSTKHLHPQDITSNAPDQPLTAAYSAHSQNNILLGSFKRNGFYDGFHTWLHPFSWAIWGIITIYSSSFSCLILFSCDPAHRDSYNEKL